jgi:hypothetical protein
MLQDGTSDVSGMYAQHKHSDREFDISSASIKRYLATCQALQTPVLPKRAALPLHRHCAAWDALLQNGC